MPLITLLTDFGYTDHYLASLKASLLRGEPSSKIIDISHSIQKFNLPGAAFTLQSVFREFPEGTIHLVSVNAQSRRENIFVITKIEGHLFVGRDNGLFSLISESEPEFIIELDNEDNLVSTFPAKAILAPAVIELCKGRKPEELGTAIPELQKMLNRQPRLTHNQIIGQVIHVDTYGNLITNIEKKAFDGIGKGRGFTISFSREKLNGLSKSYSSRDAGDCLALFNHNGIMEIAINLGNASELLGMHYNSPVMINFEG